MSSELTPAERSLRARAAAYRLHSLYDSRQLTANARAAFQDRFTKQVDPDGGEEEVCTAPAVERVVQPDTALAALLASRRRTFQRLYQDLKNTFVEFSS